MKKKWHLKLFYIWTLSIMLLASSFCSGQKFVKVLEFRAPEARQGIAVDANYIYVVGTQEIGKYNKETRELVAEWKGKENNKIIQQFIQKGALL